MVQPVSEIQTASPGTPQRASSDATMLKAAFYERHRQNYGMFKWVYQKAAQGLDKDIVTTYPSRATCPGVKVKPDTVSGVSWSSCPLAGSTTLGPSPAPSTSPATGLGQHLRSGHYSDPGQQ